MRINKKGKDVGKEKKLLKDIKLYKAEKDSHMYFSQCEYRIWHICYWQWLLNEFKQIELTNQYIRVKLLIVRCIDMYLDLHFRLN